MVAYCSIVSIYLMYDFLYSMRYCQLFLLCRQIEKIEIKKREEGGGGLCCVVTSKIHTNFCFDLLYVLNLTGENTIFFIVVYNVSYIFKVYTLQLRQR